MGVLVIAVHGWSFAQEADTSGFISDISAGQDIHGRISSLKDVSPLAVPQTDHADASEHHAQQLLSAGCCRIAPAKTKVLFRETGEGKSYIIPALEIPAFLVLLNMYDRVVYPHEMEGDKKSYETSPSTFWENLTHGHWVIDHDSFAMNQFAHPYQGTVHLGFARSAGLNFWESFLYANVGSFLWELGGEATHPSINDQIATGTGGSFFGEALFRMAGLMLETDGASPGLWRELGAAVLSPATGINRLAFGNRFKAVFPSRQPAMFWTARLGINLNSDLSDENSSSTINRIEPAADFALAYGLPGKPDYSYSRPFDYFHFEIAGRASSENALDNLMIRGLLLGRRYEAKKNYRGIWGLYGGYDYISPYMIPVSSTSVSLGTTFQWWLSKTIALQGSALGGVGYAAAGYLPSESDRDYHYGIAPQGLLALRLILGERAMLDFTGRTYYVSDVGGDEKDRTEAICRLNMGATVRIHGRHALGLQYVASLRDARYPDRADVHQTAGTVSLFYTWLGDTRFGAVDWRE